MKEEEIRQILEQVDPEGKISQSKKEELVSAMKERESNPLKDGDSRVVIEDGKEKTIYFHTLKEQMENETDWRKKASIAAKIISLNLE